MLKTGQDVKDDTEEQASGGWVVGYSAALELDFALYFARVEQGLAMLSEELTALVLSVPQEWREQGQSLLGDPQALQSLLEEVAELAGVLLEGDYQAATLAIRELSVEEALGRVTQAASPLGLAPKEGLSEAECLADLALRLKVENYNSIGFRVEQRGVMIERWVREFSFVPRILRGGDLYSRFWHWLDRFYYEVYRPWRSSRVEAMVKQEKRAVSVLGAREESGTSPDVSWLPRESPLLRYPEMRESVEEGRVKVFFWVDPFGLSDAGALGRGLIVVSFSEPGALYENFRTFASDLATRTAALSDPTRLIILRMIRHVGMINTEIADYLGLSRPTVSVHTKILREAGLITSTQEGRGVKHQIIASEVRKLYHDLELFLDIVPVDDDRR